MRTVFLLKQIKGPAAIDALQGGMSSPSVLLKHEIAYGLGQLQDTYAVPFLERTLRDSDEHPIVRHECAEALAAIGQPSSLLLLTEYAADATIPVEVRETCQLALDMIAWRKAHPKQVKSKYMSVDPAPPFKKKEKKSVAALEAILLDPSRSMFERYRAMFSLRNMETDDAVLALSKGFTDSSALFKHEIAFVFGQMQHKASIPALKEVCTILLIDYENHYF
jgi:deoxyhypusine monooxygenase